MSGVAGDLDIYVKQGFGVRLGFGARPALLIVDFINAFNNPEQLGGGNIQEAIDNTARLLDLARHLDLPIAFTSHVYAEDGSDDNITSAPRSASRTAQKGPATMVPASMMRTPRSGLFRLGRERGISGSGSWRSAIAAIRPLSVRQRPPRNAESRIARRSSSYCMKKRESTSVPRPCSLARS